MLENFIPLNKSLDLISFSEQRLTKFVSRILVTMKRNNTQIACANNQLISPHIDTDSIKNLGITCTDDLNTINLNDSVANQEVNSTITATKLDTLNQFRDKYFTSRKF